ncbi:hypothetical protein AXK57_21825 [Tsukamurella pulmonis]|uniref:hypothetical protein n=1 Tax=Tsukamurella pulmonis TaxID=47312 RepID=UPI00079BAD3E|nr:hypothetical protein [Tsukamurella pulmonis]KXP11584.1 hypothetical protein AXK57_21825 [Tsukamurella pulmonis]
MPVDIKCQLPQNAPREIVCSLPDPAPWWETPTVWTALLAAGAAALSAAAAWRSYAVARAAHTATGQREQQAKTRLDAEAQRAKELALFDLYTFVTSGSVRAARSKLMARRRRFGTVRPLVRLYVKDYFELVWALELVYGTLDAHTIAPDDAARVLGFHVRQIQEHIARFHQAQRVPGKFGVENTRTWKKYGEDRARWDSKYSALAATVPSGTVQKNDGARKDEDPALTGQ